MAIDLLEYLSLLDLGEYVLPICVAAAVLWYLGLHNPFLLTAASFGVGLPVGFSIDRSFGKPRRTARRKRGAP